MMKFERKLLASLGLGFSLLTSLGCTSKEGASSPPPPVGSQARGAFAEKGQRVYFDMADPTGDDRGPGRYEYPTSFQGRVGFLDITRFRVEDSGRFVTFLVEFRRPISRRRDDGTTEAKNFWLQLVDIYIDQDGQPGSGNSWTLPGRNLVFKEDEGWEKMVLITPGHSRSLLQLIRFRSNEQELVKAQNDILIPNRVVPQAYSLKVAIPKSELGGEPQAHWKYQVLAMGYDPSNLAHRQLQNMKVNRFPDSLHFGGGTDAQGNTNVIDVLSPTKEDQYSWLSNFASRQFYSGNRFAILPMMKAQAWTAPPPPAREAPAPRPPQAKPGAPPQAASPAPGPAQPPASQAGWVELPPEDSALTRWPPPGDNSWSAAPSVGAPERNIPREFQGDDAMFDSSEWESPEAASGSRNQASREEFSFDFDQGAKE